MMRERCLISILMCNLFVFMYCALQFIMKFEEIAPQQIRLLTGRAGNNCMVNIYFEISIVERMTVVW